MVLKLFYMQIFRNVLQARIPALLFFLSIGFSLLFFTPGLSARPGFSSDMGVSESEFLALSALYEKTDGDRWFNNTNWLSPPVSDWHGVTVTNGTVTELVLSENNLSGHLPPELGNLSNLILLALDHNHITGEIPPELGELSNLLLLSLWSNQLSGTIPPELGSLSKLELLSLSENALSGEIPSELAGLSSLMLLYLAFNNLTGEIPHQLGGLQNLLVLSFWSNQLSGTIPPEFGNLSKLELLSLAENNLGGPVPPELGNLSNLVLLYLEKNELNGEIPPDLGNLPELQVLSLSANNLSGNIPPELGNLNNLYELYLWDNRLEGEIPSTLGNLSRLVLLYLDYTQLSGRIPPELGNLSNLLAFSLWSNRLSGLVPPELGNLSNLELLSLSENKLSGPVPSELGNLSKLQALYLDRNHLSGEIPRNLANLSDLQVLYLSGNALSGNIPSELTRLTNLNPGMTSISYNKLMAAGPFLPAFLDEYFEGWQLTQTITPNIHSVIRKDDQSVEFRWKPVEYSGDDGYYLVRYGTSPDNLADSLATRDKTETSLVIDGLDDPSKYYFAVQTRTNPHFFNSNTLTSPLSIVVQEYVGSNSDNPDLVDGFELEGNYPNPFNTSTVIRYALPEQTAVRLEVFDAVGRHVATLVNESIPPGKHEVHFDASGLSSGVYLYQLQSSSFTGSRRMLLVR